MNKKEMKLYNLFIDDQIDDWMEEIQDCVRRPERIDPSRKYIGVKTIQEAIDYVESNGCPIFISFDHDLGIVNGREETTPEFVEWLINKDMDSDFKFIPDDFSYQVHSANNQAVNKLDRLNQYLRRRKDGFFK